MSSKFLNKSTGKTLKKLKTFQNFFLLKILEQNILKMRIFFFFSFAVGACSAFNFPYTEEVTTKRGKVVGKQVSADEHGVVDFFEGIRFGKFLLFQKFQNYKSLMFFDIFSKVLPNALRSQNLLSHGQTFTMQPDFVTHVLKAVIRWIMSIILATQTVLKADNQAKIVFT